MRIHIVITFLAVGLSFFFDFTRLEYALLFFVFGVVLAAEIFNTAIERLADQASPGYSRLVRTIKDMASGGVLAASLGAAGVGVCLFARWDKWADVFAWMWAHPLSIPLLAAYIALSIIFISKFNLFRK